MLRIDSVILRKEPNSSVGGSYKDNDHSGIVLLGRRLYTDIPNNGLGERNAVDIIHSFGIDMFPSFQRTPHTKSKPALPNFQRVAFMSYRLSLIAI